MIWSLNPRSAWDSVHLYEAVDIANPSGLGDAPDLDVTDPASKERLLKENVGLFEVFKIASAIRRHMLRMGQQLPNNLRFSISILDEAA